ncbi:ubiquinone biosynthesis hydroxylase [Rhodoplanes sp. Z2-YC6860]|uniref:ubiquinone biosynthesis hydroxylase n=1 Tax=Rhodoplanes sp. Z2-YC6860 TaxID=674703 RepID=UPI00078BF3FE|nr:ubiquinone biosynthesis hydroxylase [Rhodoplanes sp. Z2-YC6860]AMN38669.1 2-octaprenyl-6-methoxyphenol hydroxylase [Rhodoplanes sp. Z2-YC6860]
MAIERRGERIDLVIGGGGFAGLALAIALRQALGDPFKVLVADPAFAKNADQGRASAIAAAARRLFETIGIWCEVEGEAQPILDMVVTDSKLADVMRPTYLTFAGEIASDSRPKHGDASVTHEPFAHMIENHHVIDALIRRAKACGVELSAESVTGFEINGERADVALSGGGTRSARLLVAADGARSRIREAADIESFGWEYGQSGIVTTVAHEREHHGRAEEHFLPAGPFAILPLKGKRSSIVWTEKASEAARIVALPDAQFHDELEQRFGLKLGEIEAVGPRKAFPLGLSVARTFIAERVALVGDAAHVIHPIAGQGLNLGLRDVAALAEAVADAARLGCDIGGPEVLKRYERWRRFDTMMMGVTTDGLNRLFSNRSDALRIVRDVGLGLVERMPRMKEFFIREAAGITGEVPKLLRGEAL